MPDYQCYCGSGFYSSTKNKKLVRGGNILFCSLDCLSSYLGDLPVKNLMWPDKGSSPFVSDPYDVWDIVTNRFYRSTYEVYVARYLKDSNNVFFYESRTLIVGTLHYTPDFWLPALDLYIEVKGPWAMSAKKKFDKVQKSRENIILLPWHLYPMFKSAYGKFDKMSHIK